MTARIQQSVVPRRQSSFSARVRSIQPKRSTRRTSWMDSGTSFNRGSATNSTLTVTFSITALIALAVLGFFYLQQVLGTASQGTDIHALEQKMVQLRQEHRELELQGASLRSLDTVEQNVQKLNLVDTSQVSYLNNTTGYVAIAVE